MPYGYYILLRLVICSISAYTAYVCFSNRKKVNLGFTGFGFFTLLHNPIIPMNSTHFLIISIQTIRRNCLPKARGDSMSEMPMHAHQSFYEDIENTLVTDYRSFK